MVGGRDAAACYRNGCAVGSLAMNRTLLLVTGAGRSGTSTVAGTLHHLGVHVPGPFLEANDSNPRGFYESRWSVEFHNRLLKRAHVTIADGRPEAADIVREATSDKDRAALAEWVAAATTGHAVTAVKDPRTSWTLDLWSRTADDLGVSLSHLVMLRHPAEVLGSRATHYSAGIETMGEAGFAVKNLAGWVNAMIMTERQTRGRRRAFVRYDDLLADWRTAMSTASPDLGIELDTDLTSRDPHPVDTFIDPQLSRHQVGWSDIDMLPDLKEVATQVWQACERLADSHGMDSEAQGDLDAARARYAEMYLAAQHLSHDSIAARVQAARQEARRAAVRASHRNPSTEPSRTPEGRTTVRAVLGRLRRRGR